MTKAKYPLFPEKIADQVGDLHTKFNYLDTPPTKERLGISDEVVGELSVEVNAVDSAYARTIDTDHRTKLDTIALHEAIGSAHELFRKYLEFYVARNKAATEGDFEALHVPMPGKSDPLPVPHHPPGLRHLTSSNMEVVAAFFNADTNADGKPEGAYGMETYYKLGGEEPTEIGELTERAMATASPLRLQFEFEDQMKVLYLAFRWVGTRGDYGSWTGIFKINVTR
ncbi:MAG: hypothetical protein LBT48_03035 [Prevotellaceae bacterium]|jgi:hypothetical protein|nr:hypothetical protein [Prevotellaceae bacterium]